MRNLSEALAEIRLLILKDLKPPQQGEDHWERMERDDLREYLNYAHYLSDFLAKKR